MSALHIGRECLSVSVLFSWISSSSSSSSSVCLRRHFTSRPWIIRSLWRNLDPLRNILGIYCNLFTHTCWNFLHIFLFFFGSRHRPFVIELFFFFLTTSFKFRPSVNAVNTNAELRGLRSAGGAGNLWTCSYMLAG